MISQTDIEDMSEDDHVARQAAAMDDPQVCRATDMTDAQPETMAWGVVDKTGNLDPHTVYPHEWMAERKVDPGERLVRVAIRVVEGSDDEA